MKRLLLLLSIFLCTFYSHATVYGPYSMDSNVTPPANYTKVVVFSRPFTLGGYIILENTTSGDIVTLTALNERCFYYVPNGTYLVNIIADNRKAIYGGNYVQPWDTINFSGGASIIFEVDL